MKKALAILMVLAMVTGVAFAADAPKTFGNESVVAVTGNATLTWGVDLNEDGGSAFNNQAEWKISIPLLAKQTFTKTGKGNYAEIKINDAVYIIDGKHDQNGKSSSNINKDFEANKGDKKIGGIAAKLVFGDIYITVYDKPGFKPNNAQIWDPIKSDGYNGSDTKEGRWLRFEPGFSGYGTKIGYKAAKFDVGVKIASFKQGSSVVPLDAERSKYAFGIDATVTPVDMLTASLTFNNAMWETANVDSIMSLGAKVVAKPIDGLTATLGLDAGNDYLDAEGDQAFAYDALVSAAYKYAEVGFYYASVRGTTVANVNDAGYVTQFGSVDSDGAAVADGSVYFKVMDGGAVPNLGASFTLMMNQLMSDHTDEAIPMAFGLNVNYKHKLNDVNYVKPWANVWGQNMFATATNPEDIAIAFEVGADYGLFTNAVITAKYVAGGTNDNKHLALLKTAASGNDDTDSNDKGTFSVAVKITY